MKNTLKIIIAVVITGGIMLAGQTLGAKPDKVQVYNPRIPNVDQQSSFVTPDFDFSSLPTVSTSVSATGTETVLKYIPYLYDTPLKSQGYCGIYRDADGGGYTYVTYLKGVQILSTTGCTATLP